MAHRQAAASWRARVSSLSVLVVLLVGMQACGAHTTSAPERATDDQPRQSAHFALLRTPPEGLPASIRRVLRAPTLGMNWRLAQRIPVVLPGSYWIVPGDRYLCIVARADPASPGVGTTCARTAQAIEHGIAAVTIAPARPAARVAPSRLIVGVTPDGTRTVLVHTHEAVAKVPVVDTVFVRHDSIAAPPDLLTLRGTTTP
jgi:hypothetical protein